MQDRINLLMAQWEQIITFGIILTLFIKLYGSFEISTKESVSKQFD